MTPKTKIIIHIILIIWLISGIATDKKLIKFMKTAFNEEVPSHIRAGTYILGPIAWLDVTHQLKDWDWKERKWKK